jgi:hypothetical protein
MRCGDGKVGAQGRSVAVGTTHPGGCGEPKGEPEGMGRRVGDEKGQPGNGQVVVHSYVRTRAKNVPARGSQVEGK